MARDLFATAAVLALVGAVELLLSPDASSESARTIAVLHGVCVALFTASGLLCRHASLVGRRSIK